MHEELNDVTASPTGRLKNFSRHSKNMWENLNDESFRRVRSLIESHHTTAGDMLCGLSQKIAAWENEVGWEGTRPVQRAEFITPQMRNSVNRINEIQDSAPALIDI